MKTLLAAVPAALFLSGCLCGGFDGQSDQVLRTANGDAMQLCSNGGYSVMMANGTFLEGHFSDDHTEVAGSNGETGARAFTMKTDLDGTGSRTSPELGGGWTPVTLDKVELDHAHVQCADLEARAWWSNSGAHLPADTAFARTTGEVTEKMLLCADGTANVPYVGGTREVTSYTANAGTINIWGTFSMEGIYSVSGPATGTLTETAAGQPRSVWTRISVSSLTGGMRCGQ